MAEPRRNNQGAKRTSVRCGGTGCNPALGVGSGEAEGYQEFKVSLVYLASSRPTRTT